MPKVLVLDVSVLSTNKDALPEWSRTRATFCNAAMIGFDDWLHFLIENSELSQNKKKKQSWSFLGGIRTKILSTLSMLSKDKRVQISTFSTNN